MDPSIFKDMVALYVNYEPASAGYDEKNMADLVRKCHTAIGSITRWAAGHSAPPLVSQEAIVNYIFERSVAKYIDYDRNEGTYDDKKKRELASKFVCMPSWVVNWAAGRSDPHPLIKRQVVRYINRRRWLAMAANSFQEIVAEYVEYKEIGLQVTWSEKKVKTLVDEFETTRKTVICWADGITNPRKATKESVIRFINAQKK